MEAGPSSPATAQAITRRKLSWSPPAKTDQSSSPSMRTSMIIPLPPIIVPTITPPLVISIIHTITKPVKGIIHAVAEALDVTHALAKILRHVFGDILYAVDGPVPAVFNVLGYIFYILDLQKKEKANKSAREENKSVPQPEEEEEGEEEKAGRA